MITQESRYPECTVLYLRIYSLHARRSYLAQVRQNFNFMFRHFSPRSLRIFPLPLQPLNNTPQG